MKLPNGYGSVVKLSGKRRKPWMVRKTTGYRIDPVKEKKVNEYIIIGYAATKTEGLQMLADYNRNPYDTKAAKMTFDEVYEEWSKKKFPTVSESNIKGYKASYKTCGILYNRVFKDLKLADLQQVIDTCGKNFPTLKKIKILFNQLYEFALKNDICNKDYSTFVEIAQYKDRNPNKHTRTKFTKEEVAKVWTMKEDKYYQIILMLLYNGTRISEFLDLKKENVHLEEQYFDTEDGKRFLYRNYYDSYWTPLVEQIGIDRTPHCTRHTCISMLSEAGVQDTTIKKIVGHSGAMTLTEKVYTHLDMQVLVDAINKTLENEDSVTADTKSA